MTTNNRWQVAQRFERRFWADVAAGINEGKKERIDFYRWRAEQVGRRLDGLGLQRIIDGSAAVLEIGSGPVGIVAHFPARERVAVDPLEEFYSREPRLVAFRTGAVTYQQGVGEALPCEDGRFDLVIIDNCIDHVRDADCVMREVHRVLKEDGKLYLAVNVRSKLGFAIHRALSRLKLDPGHPHTFTPARVQKLLERCGLRSLDTEVDSFWRAWRTDLIGGHRRDRAKALLGISEYVVSVVAERT